MKGYNLHHTTEPFLKQVRRHKKPYTTRVLGKEIIVYPNMMSPRYDPASRFHIQSMPDQKGRSFLEIGCGCGIISLFAYFQGAKKIVAVDINPAAVENTRANLERYGIRNAEVFESDMFDKVRGRFDTITFAAPYHGSKPRDMLEYSVSDHNYCALRSFLKQAREHLKPGGKIILGFSDTGDTDLLKRLLIENRLVLRGFRERRIDDWKARLYILEPIELRNSAQEFIYDNSYFWFRKHKTELTRGRILNVGSGLGYMHYFMKLHGMDVTSLDIARDKESLFPDDVVIYDGRRIPFRDNQFDTVLAAYVLHHERDNKSLFGELARVSRRNIIIVEELYTNIFSKLYMVFNCWLTNKRAGQKSDVIWSSYLNTKKLMDMISDKGLEIKKTTERKRRLFREVSLVLSKR